MFIKLKKGETQKLWETSPRTERDKAKQLQTNETQTKIKD